jgi:hydroxysqualene dehydroxylase
MATYQKNIAVIGGGWAGIAAAIEATQAGHAVTLYEMAHQLGGRARGLAVNDWYLDNGQHILIGAYTQTLRLMRLVGVDIDRAMLRTPLALIGPNGLGLRLRKTHATPLAFGMAVLRHPTWSWADRLFFLRAVSAWVFKGFCCPADMTVAQLTHDWPEALRRDVIEPLCIAALNTPADQASAQVFLRIQKDGLLTGRGASDLLLPAVDLGALFPEVADRWLTSQGAVLEVGRRITSLEFVTEHWQVNGQAFDRVVLATPATEAARLTHAIAPNWSAQAAALQFEPIITVYLSSPGLRLPHPMITLPSDDKTAPAQFVFDRSQLGGPPGLLAFVISGAKAWVERGNAATLDAVIAQAQTHLARFSPEPAASPVRWDLVKIVTAKQATFSCRPGLQRPPAQIAPGLIAAGDYVEGIYPATLEGAVRSGIKAAQLCTKPPD